MPLPESVVFDFDGVILDSETPEYESHRVLFERYGCTLTVDEWSAVIGTTGSDPERWSKVLRQHAPDAPHHTAFAREVSRLFQERVPRVPMAGIVALMDALERAGVACAIASNSPSRWVLSASRSIGIAARMAAIVTRDDVERGKPAPDVYLEAARRVRAVPERSIAVEDSHAGIASAHAAGFRTIAIPHWLTAGHDVSHADLIVRSAADITLTTLAELSVL